MHANDDRFIVPDRLAGCIAIYSHMLPKMMPHKRKQSLTNMDRYLEGFKARGDSVGISWPRGEMNAMHNCG